MSGANSRQQQVLPHSGDAEEALIACCFIDPEVMDRCMASGVIADSFYVPAHTAIFSACLRCWEESRDIDEILVSEELKTAGQLEEIGGLPALNRIIGRVETSARSGEFIDLVRSYRQKRLLIKESQKVVQAIQGNGKSVEEVSSNLQNFLLELCDDRSQTLQRIGDVVPEAIKDMEEIRLGGRDAKIKLSTGLKDLDDQLLGWHNGELIIVAARPSVGKSSMAMTFAEAASIKRADPLGTVIFAVEMTNKQMVTRFISHQARVDYRLYIDGSLRQYQIDHYQAAAEEVGRAPIWFEDRSNINVWEVRRTLRDLKMRHGVGLAVIDYLQLLQSTPGSNPSNRENEVSEISRGLKSIAKELQIPVIAMAQLSRSNEREHRKPRLSDLRESGGIEADADVVILLHREEATTTDGVVEKISCNVAKQRNGPVGEINLSFLKKIMRFENRAKNEEEANDIATKSANPF